MIPIIPKGGKSFTMTTLESQWDIPSPVIGLLITLHKAGYPSFLVGGCVRDLLLGKRPYDYDITTSAHPQVVLSLFPTAIPTGLSHGTVTIPTEIGGVEVTAFRKEGGYTDGRHPTSLSFDATLEEDLARRDFTINGMALGLGGQVVDLHNGQQDLEGKLIRTIGTAEARFGEDGLRLFRALRFQAQLGFTLSEETALAIKNCAYLAQQVSKERIYSELEKILLSKNPQAMEQVITFGLLAHLFPATSIPSLQALRAMPPTALPRWREFCRLTRFPITALPVSRTLRQGILHPERQVIQELALSGKDLRKLGFVGQEIGEIQKKLARYVIKWPERNSKTQLERYLLRYKE